MQMKSICKDQTEAFQNTCFPDTSMSASEEALIDVVLVD